MRELNRILWQRLSPLLDRALDLEPPARDALLAAVRADDAELGAALEALLTEHHRVLASDFLETPALALEGAPSMAGQAIGGYTLVRPLGMGGMGTVWLARRSDGRFEGNVAVKLVNLAVLDGVSRERFRREGTLLARLSHPHIARLFDAGVTEGGQPFLVLEYVEGTRIDLYAAERKLPVDARLDLFLQVADAVAHAHANLVVHRDLKPSNVLVDTQGRVKLLDFGIAALVADGSGSGPSTLTLEAGRALTPEYAAPEQVAGGGVTTATDVYALGVLLYQLLAGRHPTALAGASQAAILHALAAQEPRRLSDAVSGLGADDPDDRRILDERGSTRDRLVRAYRGDLDTIAAKALKKVPAERYQTVTALADDVRRHMRNEPVAARPDSVWYRTRKLAARRRIELGASLGIALALVAGTGIAVQQARRSARERDHALEQLRRAEVTNDFSSFLLSEATPPSGKPLTNSELLTRGEEHVARRFASDNVLRVHMQLVVSERYYENSQFDRWRAGVERAFTESRSLPDVRLRARATCMMAWVTGEQGNYERAHALLAEALGELAPQEDTAAEEADCRVVESITAHSQGDAPRAVQAGERAVGLEENRRGPPGRELDALNALANAYAQADRFAAADRTYRKMMASFEAQGQLNTRLAAIHLTNWAVALEAGGQPALAAPHIQRAVATFRQLDSEHGPGAAMLRTLGSILSVVGLHDAAIAAVDEAVAGARTAGSPIGSFWALGIASRVYGEAGRLDRSEAMLRELQAIASSQKDLPVRERAGAERFLAQAAIRRGNGAAAVDLAQSAVKRLEAAVHTSREMLQIVSILATALNTAGRFEEARATAQRALEIARRRQDEYAHTYEIGLAALELGVAEVGLTRHDAARQWLVMALANLRETVTDNAPAAKRASARLAALDKSAAGL